MSLLAAIALARAAPVQVHVTGLGRSRAASVVLRGEAVQVGACRDDGLGADAGADGIWTCSVPGVGEADVGLLRDGQLLHAGSTSAGQIWLELSKGRTVLHEQAAPPGEATTARAPAATVLVRLTGLSDAVPPVVQLTSPQGTAELSCHDDGSFPEVSANDSVFGCGGPLDAAIGSATVTLKAAGREPLTLGEATWGDELVRFLDLDVAGSVSTARFPLALEAAAVDVAEAPAAKSDRSAKPSLPPGAVEAERLPTEPGGYRWGGVLVALGLGLGLGLAFGRRRRGVPTGLEPVEPALLAPGGPRPSGAPIAVVGAELSAVLEQLALVRRVVVVADEVPEVAGHAVYRTASADRLEIERAVRELARTPGAPVVLVVQGRHRVVDPGALSADPTATLLGGLEGWAVLLLGAEERPPAGLASWRLEDGAWSRG